MIELKHSQHQALHTLLGTEILPEKIKKLVGIEFTALKKEVISKLLMTLSEIGDKPEDRYNQECIKK